MIQPDRPPITIQYGAETEAYIYIYIYIYIYSGPGSVVGIATGYGLDGPGIECRWGRDFPHLSRPALGPTQPPVNGYQVFSGSEEQPGRDAAPHLFLLPLSRKSRSIPLLPLWAVRPVQSLSRAIPLLPLWAVRPVQSLSACTRVHFTFFTLCVYKLFTLLLYNDSPVNVHALIETRGSRSSKDLTSRNMSPLYCHLVTMPSFKA